MVSRLVRLGKLVGQAELYSYGLLYALIYQL